MADYKRTKQFLYLSSSQKTSGSDNNFTCNFNSNALAYQPSTSESVKTYISLQQAIFPNTMTNIDSTNNVIIVNIKLNTNTAVDISVNLTQGSPDVNSLATEIQTQLQASVPTMYYAGATHNLTWTVAWNVYRQRFSFRTQVQNSHPYTYTFKFGASNPAPANVLLGFEASDTAYLQNNVASGTTWYAPLLADVSKYSIVKIKSNVAKRGYDLINNTLTHSLTLCAINTGNNIIGNNIIYEPSDLAVSRQEIDSNFTNISLAFYDRYDNLITSYQGVSNWVFVVEREIEVRDAMTRKKDVNERINNSVY